MKNNAKKIMSDLKEQCPENQNYTEYSKKLRKHFKGFKLEEIPTGEVKKEKNQLGEIATIRTERKPNCSYPSRDDKNLEFDCLRVLKGIGPATENKLKEKDYKTVNDLLNHEKWKEKAKKFLKCIDEMEQSPKSFYQEKIENNLKSNSWKIFDLNKSYNLEEFVILDIETIGLSKVPLFLIGLAEFDRNNIKITQLLARDFKEENAVILKARDLIKDRPLITFNGKRFDVPFIDRRALHHNISLSLKENLNIDVLKFARKIWGDQMDSCKLTRLEQRYNVSRVGDIPSEKVPDFYTEYTRNDNIGTLVPIIEHNVQDVVSTGNIFLEIASNRN